MGDEEVFPDDDITGGDDDGGSQKVGVLPAIVITILKYAAIGMVAIIFIVSVVLITLEITGDGKENSPYPTASPTYEGKPEIFQYWAGIEDVRTSTADEQNYTVMVKLKVGYDKNDKQAQSELIARQPQLQEAILNYFSSKTVEYLEKARKSGDIKTDLKEQINKMLSSTQIADVVILDFQVIQM